MAIPTIQDALKFGAQEGDIFGFEGGRYTFTPEGVIPYTQAQTSGYQEGAGFTPRAPLQFGGTEAPASSVTSAATAPTAAGIKPLHVRMFNSLLTNLLTKSQNIDLTPYQQRENRLKEEGARRDLTETTGQELNLSPTEQAQVRGSRTVAIRGELSDLLAKKQEFQRKVEALPNTLAALAGFAESLQEEESKLVSETFSEDAQGNSTWVGIVRDADGNFSTVVKPLGKISKGFASSSSGSSGPSADIEGVDITPGKEETLEGWVSRLASEGLDREQLTVAFDENNQGKKRWAGTTITTFNAILDRVKPETFDISNDALKQIATKLVDAYGGGAYGKPFTVNVGGKKIPHTQLTRTQQAQVRVFISQEVESRTNRPSNLRRYLPPIFGGSVKPVEEE